MQINLFPLNNLQSSDSKLFVHIVGKKEKEKLSGGVSQLSFPPSLKNSDYGQAVESALSLRRDFEGKAGTGALLSGVSKEKIVLVVGSEGNGRLIGASIVDKVEVTRHEKAACIIDCCDDIDYIAELVQEIAHGAAVKSYSFTKYYKAKADDHKTYFTQLDLYVPEGAFSKAQSMLIETQALIEGIKITRDLINEPANVIYPESFAKFCQEISSQVGMNIKVLDANEMKKLGMGALLGVAQGSDNPPALVIMEWNGDSSKKDDVIAFIGKGVTFDTGGINLKGSDHIAEMKYDMGGAGVVTGLMYSLAKRRAKINAIGVLGLVENMPSGKAQRPSDVVVSMSGQTIEVDNTDAEGRLVLADAMCYVQQNYQPKVMIDLATLTGAIKIALGDTCAGLFSNNDDLAEKIRAVSDVTGEFVWRLPLAQRYDDQINSSIADVKNVGQAGRGAGSITAAQFLKRFVDGDRAWAHLDIAGVAWSKSGDKFVQKGATGFGVALLNRLVRDYFEGNA